MKTTLNKIREHNPCTLSWKKLLSGLGKTKADDEPLDLLTILDINGLDDTLWCLRAVDGYEKEKRLLAVEFARQVQYLMTNPRSVQAIDVAEAYANGQATEEELADARTAAYDVYYAAYSDATYYSTRAAYNTTCNSAYFAAYYASWHARSVAHAHNIACVYSKNILREQEEELRRVLEQHH